MSSNDRYRGNREYRDLTVRTHYKEPGRSPRVQTKHTGAYDMKFSQDSADFRKPYEDREFIDRSRARVNQAQQAANPYPYGYPAQQPQARPQQYAQPQQPRQPQYAQPQYAQPQYSRPQQPRPRSEVRTPAPNFSQAPAQPAEPENTYTPAPKISREKAMQIDMIFKVGMMVWGVAAIVVVVILLTR
ncbi:MAG: hypothetical protein IKE53_07610 [Clostridiales bacterium]|nr:hypothetical protein [Clostridiales bacterium]